LLSRLSVSGGERLAVLRHRGLIDTAVLTSDGAVVCGGRDGSDGRPVVWCWDGAIDAHTANATDGAAVGLRWAQPLADLQLPTGIAGEMPADGPRVVGLVDDGVGGLQVAVRPAAAGTLRYLRLDTRRGAPLSGLVTLQASAGTGLRPTASRTVQISETEAGQVMRSLAVAVATATSQQLATVAADENRFAFDLYGRLRLTADGNLFVSPYSVWQALSMTMVGAADTTRQQMLAVLRHSLPAGELHPAVRRLQAELLARAHPEITSAGEPFRLSVVNDLWGQREQYFVPTFLDGLSADYGAGLRLLDFIGNPDGSRSTINRYIASATYQRITDLLPPGSINVDTRVVLTNAVYFKAGWLTPFADNQTVPLPFTRLDGSSVTMNAMAATDSFRIATGSGRTIIELPYVHGELVMDVIVPDTGQFAAVESALDAASWASAAARLQPARVALRFPKWTHRWSQSLRDPLTAMGMSDSFGPAADFSGMNGTREFFIQDVVHQAFVGVDERGTEAAAATAVIIGTTSMPTDEPIPLVVDRPFIYLIRDRSTGAVLFMGRVLQP